MATFLLPSLPPSILLGIDLLTLTTSPHFRGLSNLPTGWHFLYAAETAELSLREGFWFYVPDPPTDLPAPLFVYIWDDVRGGLRPRAEEERERYRKLAGERQGLMPYTQSAGGGSREEGREGQWPALTRHITSALLTRFTNSPTDWKLSTASCAAQDRDDIPGLSSAETSQRYDEEQELGVLGIDLKRTWREGAIGRERTEGRLDTSWALKDIISRFASEHTEAEGQWGDVILAEMEISFLMVLTLANWSCLEEWKRCVALVLGAKAAVVEHEGFFVDVLALLRRQLERCKDVEGGLFDLAEEGAGWLKALLRKLKKTLTEVFAGDGEGSDDGDGDEDESDHEERGREVKEELSALEDWLKTTYGWELGGDWVRSGMLELEDGERVEMDVGGLDEEGEEEGGEYAPVVVEL